MTELLNKNIIEKILIVDKISKESYLFVLCYPKMKQVFKVSTYSKETSKIIQRYSNHFTWKISH